MSKFIFAMECDLRDKAAQIPKSLDLGRIAPMHWTMQKTSHRSPAVTRLRNVAVMLLACVPCAVTAAAVAPTPTSGRTRATLDSRLQVEANDPVTRQFYTQNGWMPVWTEAAVQALRQAQSDRARHGLDRVVFMHVLPASANAAVREVALTRAALGYAAALAHGRVDPQALHQIYTLPRPQVYLAGGLSDAIKAGNLSTWFAALAPQDDGYAKLSSAYLDFSREARNDNTPDADIAESGVIRVGDTDDRVPAIIKQLLENEYLVPGQAPLPTSVSDPSAVSGTQAGAKIGETAELSTGTSLTALSLSPNLYTQQIADAVKRLQEDYGIAADGVVGVDALEVLNLHSGDRARALAVALERRRWLPRTPPATRIDVNLAAALMRYYRDGKLVDSRKVIVGKPNNATPQLLAPIFRLVANPTWTVPKSIERSELSNVSAAYLRKRNMVRRNGNIVQLPGANNALGLVKFDMSNKYAIYLHDTNSRSLFGRSQRHLSHGCVRVNDAEGFAALIAEDSGVAAEWQRAKAGRSRAFVKLPQNLPVRLIYQNVFVNDDGQVAFRADAYDWNGRISTALGFPELSSTIAKPGAVDISP